MGYIYVCVCAHACTQPLATIELDKLGANPNGTSRLPMLVHFNLAHKESYYSSLVQLFFFLIL